MNLLLAALKIVAEYYPGRLYRAFVIDPPSLFSYLWKVKNSNYVNFNIPMFGTLHIVKLRLKLSHMLFAFYCIFLFRIFSGGP